MVIDPRSEAALDVYRVMVGSIVPRPIALVSSISPDGVNNLAPFSFFTGVSADPPVICFSPLRNGAGALKDTRDNIERTREFVVNVVSEDMAEKMNLTSGSYPPDVDEFKVSGLTPAACGIVRAARVAESPVSMECRLLWIFDFSERPLGGSLVVGEIVLFHVADECVDACLDGATGLKLDPAKVRAIGRMAGNTYVRTEDRFDLVRPR